MLTQGGKEAQAVPEDAPGAPPAGPAGAPSRADRLLDASTLGGGVLITALGLLVMASWFARVTGVLRFGGEHPVKFTAALAFTVTGAALVAFTQGRRWPVLVAGVLDTGLGLIVLAEYALGRSLGVDQLVVRDYLTAPGGTPGRPPIITAVCLTAAGVALLAWGPWRRRPCPTALAVAGSILGGIAVTSIVGYATGAPAAYVWLHGTAMAFLTALTTLVFALCLLSVAWRSIPRNHQGWPGWLPVPAGVAAYCLANVVWLAAVGDGIGAQRGASGTVTAGSTVLGFLTAGLVALVTWLAQQVDRQRRIATAEIAWAREGARAAPDTGQRLSVMSFRSPAEPAGGAPGTRPRPPLLPRAGGAARLGSVSHRLALIAVIVLLSLLAGSSAIMVLAYQDYADASATTSAVTDVSNGLLIELLNAETGQRGYLLTSRPYYLQPYDLARTRIPVLLQRLGSHVSAVPAARGDFTTLSYLVAEKMSELTQTVSLARAGQHARALQIVDTNEGKRVMDNARKEIADLQRTNAAAAGSRRRDLHIKLIAFAGLAAGVAVLDVFGLVYLRVRLSAQRKRAVQEIDKKNAELEERVAFRTADLTRSNRELEAFTYSLAHDLRSPLRASSGFSEALLEEYGDRLDDTGRSYAQRVVAAARRMAALIDGLLDLSKVSRNTLRLEPVDLSAQAADIAAELQRRDPERHARFTVQAGVRATSDRQLVRTVLQNLFDNAWKFTSTRDETRIEFGTVADGNSSVAYYVRDNGAGFDPAYTDKLFGPFQRLHSDSEFPGTGIGLVSVRRIIERHGGATWAEGAVDKGATFYFTLNAGQVVPETDETEGDPGPPSRLDRFGPALDGAARARASRLRWRPRANSGQQPS